MLHRSLKRIFLITSKKCVEIRNITGGPSGEQVQKQIDLLEEFVQENIKNQINDSDKEEWDLVFENLYK